MARKSARGGLYAVVLVGGKGKRLRPLSTDERPKAFLSVTRDRKSMFRSTVDRVKKLIPSSQILVVANKKHAKLVRRDFPGIKKANLILEPVSRNTAPAVALAAMRLLKRDADAVMAVFPTDHYIRDEKRQLDTVKAAADFLGSNKRAIVVFGIKPTYPSTGFGYLKLTRSPTGRSLDANKVARFVEKPDISTARRYVSSGRYLWNSGAFLFTARTLLKYLRTFSPKIYRGLNDPRGPARSYSDMPDLSLDYAVMEKADDIYCIRGSYGWDDIGSFRALKKVLKSQSRKFIESDGKIVKIF